MPYNSIIKIESMGKQ